MLPRAGASAPSTEELHRSAEAIFTGPFAATRATLDYAWHGHYTPARQAVQDAIIAGMLLSGRASAHPWLVHTAGAMGAGKSHAVRELARARAFPLPAFVWIDPDRVKDALPEARALVAADPAGAGTRAHKESVLIAEIAEAEALARGKSVLVDGSLRDAEWYAKKFVRLRADHPRYRFAIVHVTAAPAAVYARAAARARATGRTVPRDVLDDALARVPASVRALSPLVDYTVTLCNDGALSVEPPETLASLRAAFGGLSAELGLDALTDAAHDEALAAALRAAAGTPKPAAA